MQLLLSKPQSKCKKHKALKVRYLLYHIMFQSCTMVLVNVYTQLGCSVLSSAFFFVVAFCCMVYQLVFFFSGDMKCYPQLLLNKMTSGVDFTN